MERLSAKCTPCQKHHVRIGQAHSDLHGTIRNPERHRGKVVEAKARLTRERDAALQHVTTEHAGGPS